MNVEEKAQLAFNEEGKVKDEFLTSNFECWRTENNEPAVTYTITKESFLINSEEFKVFLRALLQDYSPTNLDENIFRNAYSKIYKRSLEGIPQLACGRYGWIGNTFEIKFRKDYYHVNVNEIKKTSFPTLKFISRPEMISYPAPNLDFNGDIVEALRPYFPLDDMDLCLFLAWTFALFYKTPYLPILVFNSALNLRSAVQCVMHAKSLLDPRGGYDYEFPIQRKDYHDEVLSFWLAGNFSPKRKNILFALATRYPIILSTSKESLGWVKGLQILFLSPKTPKDTYAREIPAEVQSQFWGWVLKAIKQEIVNRQTSNPQQEEVIPRWLRPCHRAYPVFPVDGEELLSFTVNSIDPQAREMAIALSKLIPLNEEKDWNILDLRDAIMPDEDPGQFGKLLRRLQRPLQLLGFELEFYRISLARKVRISRHPIRSLTIFGKDE